MIFFFFLVSDEKKGRTFASARVRDARKRRIPAGSFDFTSLAGLRHSLPTRDRDTLHRHFITEGLRLSSGGRDSWPVQRPAQGPHEADSPAGAGPFLRREEGTHPALLNKVIKADQTN